MGQAFDRIFIIILENQLETAVLENAYMRKLASQGVRLSHYAGVSHPSQPNYIASLAGSTCNVTTDDCQDVDSPNLVDLLEAKGITWKAYMENLPEATKSICITPDNLYFRKHNPFISFKSISGDPTRVAKIANASRLAADLANSALPQYAWYTPNIQNDGHTPPASFEPGNPLRKVDYLASWLEAFLTPLLVHPAFTTRTLIVVTFDESIPPDQNHIYTVLLGDMVNPGTVEDGTYNHYSLLRTVEENFQLGTLGRNDQEAERFGFLWGEKPRAFNWADHHQQYR